MTFPTAGAEARRRAYERVQAERERRARDLTARLMESYRTEPDRNYAEAFYGELLRERGALSAPGRDE